MKAEEHDEEERDFVVWVEEGWDVVYVATVERPDVGREEVEVVVISDQTIAGG